MRPPSSSATSRSRATCAPSAWGRPSPTSRTCYPSSAGSTRPSGTPRPLCRSPRRPIIPSCCIAGCSISGALTSIAGIFRAQPGSSSGASIFVERGSSSPGHRSSPRPSAPLTPSPVGLTKHSRWWQEPSRSTASVSFTPGQHLFFCARGRPASRPGGSTRPPATSREALALTRRLGARGSEAHALCLAGDVASTSGAEDAEGYYREALALAGELGMRPLVAHCHLGLGKRHRRTGKRELAQEHLTTATTMYRDMDMRFWLEQVESEIRESG